LLRGRSRWHALIRPNRQFAYQKPEKQNIFSLQCSRLDWINESSLLKTFGKGMKPAPALLDILFPKVRAEILRLLFSDPGRQRYVRELMAMSGLALRTVQEELANLSAAGLITSWSNGYHRFYRANQEHELFSHLLNIVQASGRLPRVKKAPSRRKR
jgi:DNA-binding transcriptional ArsR family regulator